MTTDTTAADAMTKALDAIHDEATRILSLVPSGSHELSGGLQLMKENYSLEGVQQIFHDILNDLNLRSE